MKKTGKIIQEVRPGLPISETELHNKDFKVSIPQIEDFSILPQLWRAGADYMQGYCLEKPRRTMDYKFMQNYVIHVDTTIFEQ